MLGSSGGMSQVSLPGILLHFGVMDIVTLVSGAVIGRYAGALRRGHGQHVRQLAFA